MLQAPDGYQSLKHAVPFKYFKILFTIVRCDYFGLAWKWAHTDTICVISGLLVVRYNREHIIPLNMVWLTSIHDSSLSK